MKKKGTSRITSKGPAARRAGPSSGVPALLDVVYARAGIPAPEVTIVSPDAIPTPIGGVVEILPLA